ncbi:MAG: 4a-hydroxytetrahydrobiopterin dehydratase [Betaproteobacteria bacterium]
MTPSPPPTTATPWMALATERCRNGAQRLTARELTALMAVVPEWSATDGVLAKEFLFPDFDATMAFVNALAHLARTQNHHPDMSVHYARCVVTFSTHDAGGLTRNDFICAARTERLFA